MRLIDADAFKKYIADGIDGLILPKDQAEKAIAVTKSFLKDIDEQPTVEIPRIEWIPCSERLPKENICDDGYVEPSDYVLVFGDHGNYGVSRYWGNRRTKKENPLSYIFSDWMDLNWNVQKPIAWMPLPEPYKEGGDPE